MILTLIIMVDHALVFGQSPLHLHYLVLPLSPYAGTGSGAVLTRCCHSFAYANLVQAKDTLL